MSPSEEHWPQFYDSDRKKREEKNAFLTSGWSAWRHVQCAHKSISNSQRISQHGLMQLGSLSRAWRSHGCWNDFETSIVHPREKDLSLQSGGQSKQCIARGSGVCVLPLLALIWYHGKTQEKYSNNGWGATSWQRIRAAIYNDIVKSLYMWILGVRW